jgi:hypothetical protein
LEAGAAIHYRFEFGTDGFLNETPLRGEEKAVIKYRTLILKI